MKILLILFMAMLQGCVQRAANEKYLIPYGFKGQVFIFFDIKDGVPPKYENGFRVYDIPSNGILKTQFKPTYGYRTTEEYMYVYVDSLGKVYKLENYPQDMPPKDSTEVYITAEETGGVGIKKTVDFQTFVVKTVRDSLILDHNQQHSFEKILEKAGIKLD